MINLFIKFEFHKCFNHIHDAFFYKYIYSASLSQWQYNECLMNDLFFVILHLQSELRVINGLIIHNSIILYNIIV